MFENTFEKQLEKTLKLGAQYTVECEKLKEKFFDEYDNPTITALLELLITKGHPGEKKFATEFKKHYESDNFTDQEMKAFKKLLEKHKEEVVNSLESIGD